MKLNITQAIANVTHGFRKAADRECVSELVVWGGSMPVISRCALAVFLCLAEGTALYGQLTSATLAGQITDTSKAALPGASVAATETETGTGYKTVTNGEGNYVLPNLLPGKYNVTVSLT